MTQKNELPANPERFKKLAGDPSIPAVARAMFLRMGEHVAELDRQIAVVDADLLAQHKANPISQMLA